MNRVLSTALLIGSGLLLACGSDDDGTGPGGKSGVIGVSVVETHEPQALVDGGQVYAYCEALLRTTARESDGVVWQGAIMRWYKDAARTQLFDTLALGSADLDNAFGTFENGGFLHTNWFASATAPFTLTVEFDYTIGAGSVERTDPIHFECYPHLPAINPAAPTITNLTATPLDTIEPNALLTIHYSLNAPAGSWQEFIELANGCDTVYLQSTPMQTSVNREITLSLPGSCRVGELLEVNVYASDVRQRFTHVALATPLQIADRSRPAIASVRMVGEFGTGQPLNFLITGSDNDRLGYLLWEVQPFGLRDSVALNAASVSRRLDFPIPNGWAGSTVSLSTWLRDASGNSSDTLRSVPDSLRIYPVVPATHVVRNSPLGIRRVVFDLKRDRVYLAAEERLYIASATTLAEIGQLTIPSHADFDITPSQDSLIVSSGQDLKLGTIDLTAPTLALEMRSTDSLFAGAERWTLAAVGNDRVYLGEPGGIIEFNLATWSAKRISTAYSEIAARSADRTTLTLGGNNSVASYSVATGTVGVAGTRPAEKLSMSSTGARLAGSLTVRDRDMMLVKSMAQTGWYAANQLRAPHSAISQDGATLYFGDYNTQNLLRASVATGLITTGYSLPFAPGAQFGNDMILTMAPDGSRVMILGAQDPRMAIVDLR